MPNLSLTAHTGHHACSEPAVHNKDASGVDGGHEVWILIINWLKVTRIIVNQTNTANSDSEYESTSAPSSPDGQQASTECMHFESNNTRTSSSNGPLQSTPHATTLSVAHLFAIHHNLIDIIVIINSFQHSGMIVRIVVKIGTQTTMSFSSNVWRKYRRNQTSVIAGVVLRFYTTNDERIRKWEDPASWRKNMLRSSQILILVCVWF